MDTLLLPLRIVEIEIPETSFLLLRDFAKHANLTVEKFASELLESDIEDLHLPGELTEFCEMRALQPTC